MICCYVVLCYEIKMTLYSIRTGRARPAEPDRPSQTGRAGPAEPELQKYNKTRYKIQKSKISVKFDKNESCRSHREDHFLRDGVPRFAL